MEVDQIAEVVLRGFHWWNKHCTIIIKKHGIKGKQSNFGGYRQSSLLKNFIQMEMLKVLINGSRDLPTVSKFPFGEKRLMYKKIHKVWVIQSRSSFQKCCAPEDVEYTRSKTLQTGIRHRCPLWWTLEKRVLTSEALRYGVLPMVQVSIKDKAHFNQHFLLMGNHEWNLLLFLAANVWESKVGSKMHGIDVCKLHFKKRFGVTNQIVR